MTNEIPCTLCHRTCTNQPDGNGRTDKYRYYNTLTIEECGVRRDILKGGDGKGMEVKDFDYMLEP